MGKEKIVQHIPHHSESASSNATSTITVEGNSGITDSKMEQPNQIV